MLHWRLFFSIALAIPAGCLIAGGVGSRLRPVANSGQHQAMRIAMQAAYSDSIAQAELGCSVFDAMAKDDGGENQEVIRFVEQRCRDKLGS